MSELLSLEQIKSMIRQEILQKEQLIRDASKSHFDQDKIERIVIGFTAEITAYQNVITMLNRLNGES